MRTLRTALIVCLALGVATQAFAGDLQQSVAKAASEQAQQPEERAPAKSVNKPLVYSGAALFVVGMSVGLYAFINNKNGSFAEFGEANAVNKELGAAGLITAFAGGTMMFLGSHRAAKHAPSVAVGPGGLKVSKQLSW
ncbi:MAG TPA: hypothetical protein VKD69_15205 [Vicinamibacterales bacterium]|nr:hypothetical protein [Vicinamibacterales bacterium]